MVLGLATVHFADKKLAVEAQKQICWMADFHDTTGTIDWEAAQTGELSEDNLDKTPAAKAQFAALPGVTLNARAPGQWQKSFADAVYRLAKVDLLRSEASTRYRARGDRAGFSNSITRRGPSRT